MADNVGYTPGSGASIAADEISGVLYQRIKPTFGIDGQATDVSLNDGLPVNAVGELLEAIEALRFAVNSLTKTIGTALPNAQGQPIMEARQATATNLNTASTQAGTWNIATVSTLTTLSTLTNQTQIGGFAANDQIPTLMHMQIDGLRRNITVT